MKTFSFLLIILALSLGCREQAMPGILPEINPTEPAPKQTAAWGDSFTYGGGISMPQYAYPVQLQKLAGQQVYNGGVNGETSTQIKSRMLAAADKKNYNTIIWVGNNNYWQRDIIKSDIAQMVASLGHKRFVVISLLNDQYQWAGTSDYNRIIKLNNDLKELYGSNYLDVRSYLVSHSSGSAQDERDKANDVIPTSLRYDSAHPNDKGYQLVAEFIYKNFAAINPGH
jgi:lysophospholipase L1-like esterase